MPDPRQPLLQMLEAYQPLDMLDLATRDRFIAFVVENDNCFERSLLTGHITASTWIVDQTGKKVLIALHRKLNKWLQLGGHADSRADLLQVAIEEAREESGLPDFLPIDDQIFDLDIHEIPKYQAIPAHLHFDVRFLLRAGAGECCCNDELLELRWIELDQLEQLTQEQSILRMKHKLLMRFGAGARAADQS